MTRRQLPPGRTSISDIVVVNPCGPHHFSTCLGSVHIWKTRSRGALNNRVSTISRSAPPFASIGLWLVRSVFSRGISSPVQCRRPLPVTTLASFLNGAEINVQPVEAFSPEPVIVFNPIGCVLQGACTQAAGPQLSLTSALDQAGPLQHFQVLGNSRKAHLEGLGEFRNRCFAGGKPVQDSAPRGVSQSCKGGAEVIHV